MYLTKGKWRAVLDPMIGGYSDGFIRDKVYSFKHGYEGEVSEYRLIDKPPYMNVWGLFYWDEEATND